MRPRYVGCKRVYRASGHKSFSTATTCTVDKAVGFGGRSRVRWNLRAIDISPSTNVYHLNMSLFDPSEFKYTLQELGERVEVLRGFL